MASLYARVGADVQPFNRAMQGVEGKLHGIGGAFGTLGGVVTDVFKIGAVAAIGATTAAIGGLTAVIVKSTESAADMEQQVANIAAVMGLTADETDKVSGLINSLGLDPNLKVSAVEAGQAIEMLAKNGLSLDQIMGGAARSTVLLANSTGADFASAADTATSAMMQFGIKAEDMGHAVDQIVGVTNVSKFGFEDYSLALAQAGGVAASVGVSFEDFNATIAAISPLFASGSDAGTSFKTFLQRLIPQSKSAEGAMKKLGLMTEDGKNAFFDANGQLKDMADIAGLLNKAFSGLSEEQKNEAASTIFGTDAMRAAFAIAGITTDQFNQLKQVMGNTNAEDAAATRMNTFSGKMEIFRGVLEAVSIGIGQKFLPLATRIVEWATDFLSSNADKIIGWFGELANGLAAFGNYLFAVMQDGDFLNDWLTYLPEALRPAVEWVGRFVAGLRDIWTAFQAGGINGALAELGGKLTEFGKGIVTWVTSPAVLGSIATALASWGDVFLKWATDLWITFILPGLMSTWTNLVTWVTDVRTWAQIWNGLVTWSDTFAKWAGGLWMQYVQPGMDDLWTKLAGPGGWIETNVPVMKTWYDALTTFIGAVKDEWEKKFPEVSDKFATWKTDMGTALGEFMTVWGGVFGDGKTPGSAADAAKKAVEVITQALSDMMTGSIGLVKWATNIGKVVQLLKQLVDAIDKGDWGRAGDLFNQIDKIPITPGWMNNPYNPLTGGPFSGNNAPTNGGGYGSQSYTPIGNGSNGRVDLYVHNGAGMPADRESIRSLAVALRKELDLTGAVMVR